GRRYEAPSKEDSLTVDARLANPEDADVVRARDIANRVGARDDMSSNDIGRRVRGGPGSWHGVGRTEEEAQRGLAYGRPIRVRERRLEPDVRLERLLLEVW